MSTYNDLLRQIEEAKNAAIRENIRANSIVINENMVKVKPFLIPHSGYTPYISFTSPMICGLNAYFTTEELPDGYSFAVFESSTPNKPELDICGAIDYIYERTWIDQEVLKKVLELAKEYMEE